MLTIECISFFTNCHTSFLKMYKSQKEKLNNQLQEQCLMVLFELIALLHQMNNTENQKIIALYVFQNCRNWSRKSRRLMTNEIQSNNELSN